MKLTKAQATFIENVKELEERLNNKLWLLWDNGKWIMGIRGESYIGFNVNARLLKSLTEKNILINEKFKNIHGCELEGLTLNSLYK